MKEKNYQNEYVSLRSVERKGEGENCIEIEFKICINCKMMKNCSIYAVRRKDMIFD